jgi:hypothetical protein
MAARTGLRFDSGHCRLMWEGGCEAGQCIAPPSMMLPLPLHVSAIELIQPLQRDAAVLLHRETFGNFPPRLALLALLADKSPRMARRDCDRRVRRPFGPAPCSISSPIPCNQFRSAMADCVNGQWAS